MRFFSNILDTSSRRSQKKGDIGGIPIENPLSRAFSKPKLILPRELKMAT